MRWQLKFCTSQDGVFICLNNLFYAVGWEGNKPALHEALNTLLFIFCIYLVEALKSFRSIREKLPLLIDSLKNGMSMLLCCFVLCVWISPSLYGFRHWRGCRVGYLGLTGHTKINKMCPWIMGNGLSSPADDTILITWNIVLDNHPTAYILQHTYYNIHITTYILQHTYYLQIFDFLLKTNNQ
jgi:hypothetical protein